MNIRVKKGINNIKIFKNQLIGNQYSSIQSEMNEKLTQALKIGQVYPDVKEELGNRHVNLMSQLRLQFNELYDGFQPSHYVIMKGLTDVLSMSSTFKMPINIENGIIFLMAKTTSQGRIYFNGNHIDEEVIFSNQGRFQQGMCNQSSIIEQALLSVTQNLPTQFLSGIIFYVHSNIAEGSFKYNSILQLGVALGMLTALDLFHQETLGSLTARFSIANPQFSEEYCQQIVRRSLNGMKEGQLILQSQNQSFQIPITPQMKMIFCKLELSAQDIRFSRERIAVKNKIAKGTFEQKQMCQVIERYGQELLKPRQIKEVPEIQEISGFVSRQKIIELCLREEKIIKDVMIKNKDFKEGIAQLWKDYSENWNLFSEPVVELVDKIQQELDISSCFVVEDNFLMILADSSRVVDIMCYLKKKISKGQLSSKSIQCNSMSSMEPKSKDEAIKQKLFSSTVGPGSKVYDPTQSMWFD